MNGALASRRAISERQRAEKDRLRTELVPVSPSPLLRLARHSSVKAIIVGVESTLPRWIQVAKMEYARSSRISGSGDASVALSSRQGVGRFVLGHNRVLL